MYADIAFWRVAYGSGEAVETDFLFKSVAMTKEGRKLKENRVGPSNFGYYGQPKMAQGLKWPDFFLAPKLKSNLILCIFERRARFSKNFWRKWVGSAKKSAFFEKSIFWARDHFWFSGPKSVFELTIA